MHFLGGYDASTFLWSGTTFSARLVWGGYESSTCLWSGSTFSASVASGIPTQILLSRLSSLLSRFLVFKRYFGGYYTCFKFDEVKPATSKQRISFLINQHRCKLSYKYLGILREGLEKGWMPKLFFSSLRVPLHDLACLICMIWPS